MSLFPIIQPKLAAQDSTLPLYREVAWDFEQNTPIWQGGSPVLVTGAQAVLVWAWKALQVPRRRLEVYTWDYGNECDSLLGQAYTGDLKQAEAARYVRECLLINPYIQEVRDVHVTFDAQGILSIACTLATLYGEVTVHV